MGTHICNKGFRNSITILYWDIEGKANLQNVCFDSAEGVALYHFYLVVMKGSVKKTHVYLNGVDWRRGKRCGLQTKGSLVRDLAGSPIVVALSKSHLPPAYYW